MGKKILIVEDDPNVLQAMHVRLRAHHYDTSSALDAISCMAEARRASQISSSSIWGCLGERLLLMDRFKNIPALAAVPVIVVTGREVRGNLKRVIDAGDKAFLQKPVDNAKLLAVIRQALGDV